MIKSLRLQLTAWYLLFFTLLLGGLSAFVYGRLSRNLHARLDQSLINTAETTAVLFQAELAEQSAPLPAATETLHELRFRDVDLAVLERGRVLAASDRLSGLGWFLDSARRATEPRFETLELVGEHGARVRILPFDAGSHTYVVAAMEPLDLVTRELAALGRLFAWALPSVILLAGAGGFLLASKSLEPLVAMSRQAELITAKNLDKRLEVGNAKIELARLAAQFNELLSRLDRSFESMRGFMADASHEMRTPLAVIRGEADVTLAQDRPASEYRESLAIIQDEAKRLSRLVDDLLNLARADSGQRPLDIEEFYLNDLLEGCCRSAQGLARRKEIRLTSVCPGDVPFRGDHELLRRMIFNLLDNGIRYTPPGGSISARLEVEGAQARIVVADSGIGIPPEAAARVFERFYRVDKARSRADGGFGLGLSIVKWIAESHGGAVHLESQPDRGSTFTVVLPFTSDSSTVHLRSNTVRKMR